MEGLAPRARGEYGRWSFSGWVSGPGSRKAIYLKCQWPPDKGDTTFCESRLQQILNLFTAMTAHTHDKNCLRGKPVENERSVNIDHFHFLDV